MSIAPKNGARRLQRLPYFKYYDIQKRESELSVRLSAAKITDYIKNHFKLKLLRIKFPTKNLMGAYADVP